MSENALRDLNTILGTERNCEGSGKACLAKPPVDNAGENIEEWQKKMNGSSLVSPLVKACLAKPAVDNAGENIEEWQKKMNGSSLVSPPVKACLAKPPIDNAGENIEESQKKMNGSSLVSTLVNGNQAVTADSGGEIGVVEVEYIESDKLRDVEDIDTCLKNLLAELDSKDWVVVCDALNNVRRLSIFHKEAMVDMLADVITYIAKSLKNPRSAVCKTAIMTSADIFSAYNDLIIDSLDPLLVQLLLKSSQDKRFVCEAAERALISMTTLISPNSLLPKLEPYFKHKNPRIRAKASMCFSRSIPQLGAEGINAYGIDKLIQVAASQLSDRLPESREAARTLLLELQNVYEKFNEILPATISEHPEMESWENFCQSKLSPLSAQAVLRVTAIARDGLVS